MNTVNIMYIIDVKIGAPYYLELPGPLRAWQLAN